MNIYEPNISAGRRTMVIRIITRINNGRQLHANNAETNVGSHRVRRRRSEISDDAEAEFVSIDTSKTRRIMSRQRRLIDDRRIKKDRRTP
jgi:hypothetical protein